MKLEIEAASIQELAVALNNVLSKLLLEDSYLRKYKGGDELLPYETYIGEAHCKLELTGDELNDVWAQQVVINRALKRINRDLAQEAPLSTAEEKAYKLENLKMSFDELSEEKRPYQDALIDNLSLNRYVMEDDN